MSKFINRSAKAAKKYLPIIICIFFIILITKQIGMYERIVSIYETCLPVLMGIVVAFLLQPVIDRLRKRVSTKTAVIIIYSVILISVVLFFILLIPVLYQQVLDFVKVFPSWLEKIEQWVNRFQIPNLNISEMKEAYLSEGTIIVVDYVKSSMNNLTKYGITFITAFFISMDLDFWKRVIHKVHPNTKKISTFYQTMSNIVYQYLLGTFIDLLFITISVGIVLSLYQFPNGILYAVILALLNLFPYIGATIGLILIAIVGALSYDSFPFIMFVIVWVIQQIEANFIQPLIFNHTMNVRPVLTFVFIFISEAFFGVIGVILSPIFAAIAQIAFRSYLHAKTSDKVGEWEDIWYDFDEAMREESMEEACADE